MKKQEVLNLMQGEFGSLYCDVTVTDAPGGGFTVEVEPRAFSSLKLQFGFSEGMTRAEIFGKRTELIRQAFAGVATERDVAALRNELDAARERIGQLEAQKANLESAYEETKAHVTSFEVAAVGAQNMITPIDSKVSAPRTDKQKAR